MIDLNNIPMYLAHRFKDTKNIENYYKIISLSNDSIRCVIANNLDIGSYFVSKDHFKDDRFREFVEITEDEFEKECFECYKELIEL